MDLEKGAIRPRQATLVADSVCSGPLPTGRQRMNLTLGHLHVRFIGDRWSVQWVMSQGGAYQYFPSRDKAIEWARDRLTMKAVESATVHEPDGESWAL